MRYGLIGEKLGHSFSKQIHEILGNKSYELKEIPKDKISEFLQNKEFVAVNVTIPYKQTVMPYCVVDETVREIGSVNTLVNRNGILYGYNTDYLGFSYMARRAGISFGGKHVLILGSGGTCKTAAFTVTKEGASQVTILSRGGKNPWMPDDSKQQKQKGEHQGKEEFKNITISSYVNFKNCSDIEIIVNTTPVGMFPNIDDCPINPDDFPNLCAILDVVYNPLQTSLIQKAKKKGLLCSNGLSMLAAQAWYANSYFFDKEVMLTKEGELQIEEIIQKIENSFANIVLIGMPGSGKSTAGRMLAEKMKREFYDSDVFFEEKEEMSAGEYIVKYGEEAFRQKETEIIRILSAKTGVIIATGGGSILRQENQRLLKHNGKIIFLNRPIEQLETTGRPLSSGKEALELLWKERLPIYCALADVKIAVETDSQKTVQKIINYMS